MRYAGEICPYIKIVHWGVSALYPFNEARFPGIDTCNQLSLSVIDLQQVVVVAGGQCVHHRVSVCKQLHRENTHESLRTLILEPHPYLIWPIQVVHVCHQHSQ